MLDELESAKKLFDKQEEELKTIKTREEGTTHPQPQSKTWDQAWYGGTRFTRSGTPNPALGQNIHNRHYSEPLYGGPVNMGWYASPSTSGATVGQQETRLGDTRLNRRLVPDAYPRVVIPKRPHTKPPKGKPDDLGRRANPLAPAANAAQKGTPFKDGRLNRSGEPTPYLSRKAHEGLPGKPPHRRPDDMRRRAGPPRPTTNGDKRNMTCGPTPSTEAFADDETIYESPFLTVRRTGVEKDRRIQMSQARASTSNNDEVPVTYLYVPNPTNSIDPTTPMLRRTSSLDKPPIPGYQ
ncbi:hypothetical protein CIB48_g4210 [Xylaria polymorpha]|nr:hypothetical protein CIB48_g4210 [Xylaria polymorpha]